MATPQWILVQNRLQPTPKPDQTQFELNTKRRQREAVRSAIKRGVLRVLDQQLISEYTDTNDYNEDERESTTYLSLPSLSIHSIDELLILSNPNLTIVNIPCNFISDIRPLQSCINLIKLDVSLNQIQVLPDEKFWSALVSLKILYLHGNLIAEKEYLLGLGGCPQLQVLTLYDTPVSTLSNYRHVAANCILTLKALDYHVISDDEIIANLTLQGKFRALARSFNKLLYLPLNKDDTFKSEMKRIHSLLLTVDTVQSHYSPVILIQKWVRGWLTRVKISKDNTLNVIIKRRQKKSCGDLKNILSKHHSNLYTGGGIQSSSWLQQPPPSPTTPNRPLSRREEEMVATEERFIFLRRPDTAELYQAITNARSILRNPIVKKPKNKGTIMRHCPPKRELSHPEISPSIKESLSISGKHCSVETLDKVQELKDSVRESSQDIKKAKNEIKSVIQQVKTTVPNIADKRESEFTSDVHRFIRSHATMSLSLLRKIEKRYRYDRKTTQHAAKTDLVAQVRYERELRRERLANYQQIIKENIISWKNDQDRRLERERIRNELRHEDAHLRRVFQVEDEVKATRAKVENENFAVKFRQGHIKIGNDISRKKIKSQKAQETQSVADHVQTLKETESERQEIAKNYMKERERRLRRDILQDKNDLNAQMIQIASQQLMEVRQKVEKEKARKKAAQDLSPLIANTTTDTPRQDLTDAYQSIPKAPIADTGLLGPLMRACESYTCSPKSMRGRTLGSHRTWQRGSVTIEQSGSAGNGLHFPEIGRLPEETPLMYNMYRPLPQHWQNVGTTPCNSPKITTSIKNTVVPTTPVNNPNENTVVLSVGTSNLYSTIERDKDIYSGDQDRQLVNLLTYSL